jgi:pimeloyl-ACP methyl ester carboxylesterase
LGGFAIFVNEVGQALWHYPWIVAPPKQLLRALIALPLLLSAGCSSKPKTGELAPLTARSWREELDVKGFGPATVAVPLGATTPRPVVVVLHGGHDKAEWQCGSFRGVLGARSFLLCPQGQAAGDGLYGWGSFDESAAELRAGLAALKARYGTHLAKGSVAVIGYAEGATLAADLARQEPSFFGRVALVNGDPTAFSPSATKIFADRGGKRVLFFCTNADCDNRGTERALLLTRLGLQAKSLKRDVGPYLDQRFTDTLKGDMPWLFEGDTRFAAPRR